LEVENPPDDIRQDSIDIVFDNDPKRVRVDLFGVQRDLRRHAGAFAGVYYYIVM